MIATLTILLVDDDDAVRRLAAQILEAEGYVVVEASGPAEALEVCERGGPIDLLVSDVSMPDMSGRELAVEVCARRPGTPVLFVSGYDESLTHGGASRDPFLAKPFSPAELVREVKQLLPR
jgi:CheY-like chemotaxis protein